MSANENELSGIYTSKSTQTNISQTLPDTSYLLFTNNKTWNMNLLLISVYL
jgi:hypothetical protein